MIRWWMRDDRGVSLLEALVAITIVGVVMTAVASFFMRSISATGQQRGAQVASHLADTAMERVRALKGSAVADGREKGDEMPSLAAVNTMLADTTRLNKKLASGTPTLPVTPETVTVAGLNYLQYWYIGACALPSTGNVDADSDECTGAALTAAETVPVFRVVVAIVWPERNCAGNQCVFVTSSLVSSEPDEPVFNENEAAPPPTIQNPGNLTGNTVTAVDRTFAVTGDARPLTVSGDNIPNGLTLSSSGRVTGTPTKVGTFAVVIRVTDIRGRVGSASFTWTIYTAPKLNPIANQTTLSGATVNLQPVNAGAGEGALTWSVTGAVPAGITFNPSTGLFSGSPTSGSATTAAPQSVVSLAVRLTDSIGQFSEVSFTWTVNDWNVTALASRSTARNASVTVNPVVTGGRTPITWSALNLPAGLSIAPGTGRITGNPTTKAVYNTTVRATDARGQTRSTSFTWTIT
jgi:prepilin-type N-terminal cleavage/methylation domain-containing protein